MGTPKLDSPLEQKFWLKCRLLVEGCCLDSSFEMPKGISPKRIHLYAHSSQSPNKQIPDDILIGDGTDTALISRIRYNVHSTLSLMKEKDRFFVFDKQTGLKNDIQMLKSPKFDDLSVRGYPVSTVCSYLGVDLIGVTPSNYCFYFQEKKECRFCEILQTYKNHVKYHKTFKEISIICEALSEALGAEKRLSHIAITTGNIKSYDYSFHYYIELGQKLKKLLPAVSNMHVLATLMPPDDFELISELAQTYFNKIYFPLEIYDENHFGIICPGKADYGYHKILNALNFALNKFGKGNVYTNFVYGVQSLQPSLDPASYSPEKENELALTAVKELIKRDVIPAFTLYHYAGYNRIGNIRLSTEHVYTFFKEWGELVYQSNIVSKTDDTVLFGPLTLSNTLFNDAFLLAKKRN